MTAPPLPDRATDPAGLSAGDWTTTGWGAQHRVRSSGPDWTEMVCHSPGNRVATVAIDRAAAETLRCSRCADLPHLGPMVPGPTGEIRQSSDGLTAVRVGGTVQPWHLVGEDPAPFAYGWRTDWQVCAWTVVGNVRDLVGAAAAYLDGAGQ